MIARPDICYCAGKLAQFNHNPGPKHIRVAEQCIRYAFKTRELSTCYSGSPEDSSIYTASDAAFGDCPESRKSSYGHVTIMFGGLVAWKSAKHVGISILAIGLTFLGRMSAIL